MDLSKLSLQDKLILGGAALLTLTMLLPWFSLAGYSESGFGAGFLPLLAWLVGAAMAAQVALTNFKPEQEIPDLPIPWNQAHLYGGGAVAALIVLKFLLGHNVGSSIYNVDLDPSFGLYLAIIAGGALAYGGFLKSKEEDGGTSSAPPPPPTEF